jgi:hypothetical protein
MSSTEPVRDKNTSAPTPETSQPQDVWYSGRRITAKLSGLTKSDTINNIFLAIASPFISYAPVIAKQTKEYFKSDLNLKDLDKTKLNNPNITLEEKIKQHKLNIYNNFNLAEKNDPDKYKTLRDFPINHKNLDEEISRLYKAFDVKRPELK